MGIVLGANIPLRSPIVAAATFWSFAFTADIALLRNKIEAPTWLIMCWRGMIFGTPRHRGLLHRAPSTQLEEVVVGE